MLNFRPATILARYPLYKPTTAERPPGNDNHLHNSNNNLTNNTLASGPSAAGDLNQLLACAVIAGGASRRMGGIEKCLLPLGGVSLLERIIRVLSAANTTVLISANGDTKRFRALQRPIVSDAEEDQNGPISGLIASLEWLQRNRPEIQWLLISAGDTPFLPEDYVARFATAMAPLSPQVLCAEYRGRRHYLNSAWHRSTLASLIQQNACGRRSLKGALARLEYRTVDFSDQAQDPFFNINTPEDYKRAKEQRLIDPV